MKITLTAKELREFAEGCFNFGVNGQYNPRTGEDLFEKLIADTVKVRSEFKAGDVVRAFVFGHDAPNSIKSGNFGSVVRVEYQSDGATNVVARINDNTWNFDTEGNMCGFADCFIRKFEWIEHADQFDPQPVKVTDQQNEQKTT